GAPESAEKLARFGQAIPAGEPGTGTGFRVRELGQYLKRRGYRVREGADGNNPPGSSRGIMLLYACRGRFSPLGDLLFHAGFLLILFGAVTNVLTRFEGTAIIAERSPFTGSKKEYRMSKAASETVDLPEVNFDVEKISADFWNGKLFFTRLEAQLLHSGGRDIAKLSSAAQIGNAAVTIAGYGYVPRYEFKKQGGIFDDYGSVKLNIFSPGSEDYFYVTIYPHKIFVSFYPDYAEVDGKAVSKSMNPVNPAYALRIFRGRIPVYTGVIKQGEWAEYDGLSISFPSFVKSGDFRIVRNPGHPYIWASFILMGAGLVWRLLFYRKELALWQDDTGRTWLSGHGDYYPKLHAEWLASLTEEFKGKSV
ncbi:MAG: cytochrome c biogenesis protein ResB, partial [Gallionella sp.]|nr:cytochrome c biogenesis protein ResB [Gallionella sp.]